MFILRDHDYILFNVDRLHWLLDQYNVNIRFLKGDLYKHGFKSLLSGMLTIKQEEYIRNKFEITDTEFLLKDGVPTIEEYYSHPIAEIVKSVDSLHHNNIKTLLRARYHRTEYLKLNGTGKVLPEFNVAHIPVHESVKLVKEHLGLDGTENYHIIRQKIEESGVLVFSGSHYQKRMLLEDGIEAAILKYLHVLS